jgi:hypothetical protein
MEFMDLLQEYVPSKARHAGIKRSQRAGVVVVVVTAGPPGGATVVVCCVVVAGLGCSTRSDRTEQADMAASSTIKIDTRMADAFFKIQTTPQRCTCAHRCWCHAVVFYGFDSPSGWLLPFRPYHAPLSLRASLMVARPPAPLR